ncbi:hypothetical protein [Cronobacter sakazakii]|uniref:hypothetical protein n=3 Tax=Cronobacter sakazakii TaxID=28141 RepID=UPI0010544F71|nr:hypothetical protein [Cronobacter sakazakii]MCZ6110505.1 hypothetical protein [Cronobacter sakazakii]MCZ6149435.1 hypothetical protein [Cronobacter sakazakii]MCZ6412826.1 hypothetical protein [Cronobacter sakazakii]
MKSIFEQIHAQALRRKGWRRILIPELSLKYKYKETPPKTDTKNNIKTSKHSPQTALQNATRVHYSTVKQSGLKRKPSPHWHVMGFRIYVLPSSSPPGGTAQTLNPKPSYMAMAHGVIHHPFQVFEMVSRTTAKSEP